MLWHSVLFRSVFFFQAEDGIRDLVRSRGLGDVYKRQLLTSHVHVAPTHNARILDSDKSVGIGLLGDGAEAVSYTHLTLPTSDLV